MPETTQSLIELTNIANKQPSKVSSKSIVKSTCTVPMRKRAVTNPMTFAEDFNTHAICPHMTRASTSVPEQTRVNRRMKTSCMTKASPSSILIDNFKQQYRVDRHESIRSIQSSKSLVSLTRLKNVNARLHDINRKSPWYCCCCRSISSDMKNKPIHCPTPNHSFTHDEDDDEKISSTETSNRTATHPSNQLATVQRTRANSTSTPGDVQRRERIRFMKEQKTAKILAVVVGGFILLWLPFFIMYVIPPDKHNLSPYTVTLITWLGYFNSVINPFIYAYCSKQFRMAFWNITFGICIKKSTELLPISNKNKQIHQRCVNA
jgi:hypothetical protein